MDPSQNTMASMGVSGGNGVINPQNDVTSASQDDPKQDLNQVINSIQKTLGLLHQLYLNVSSFNTGLQLPLLQRINSLVLELDNMVKLSEKCHIQVPVEVLNLIDDGKNPDGFTKDVINGCIAKNQITKGKTDSFKGLRKHLLEELDQAFPDEADSFNRSLRSHFLSLSLSSPSLCLYKSSFPHETQSSRPVPALKKIVNKEGADSEASGRPRCPATAASSRFPTTTPRRKRKRKLEEVREDYIHPCMQPRHDDETTTTAATATRTTVK